MTATRYTDGGISPRTNVHAAMKMLEYAEPHIVLDKFGDLKPMPKNKTQTIKFRRPKVFTAADTPLQEGVTPSATQFAYEDVEATIKQYGQIVEISDVIEDTSEDPVLNDASEQCGENIGRTIEALTYGVLKAGTNVFYANGASRSAVNTPVSLAKVRSVVRALKAQKAKKITKMLEPGTEYATRAVEPAYVCCLHSDLEPDVRDLPGFTPVAQYSRRKAVHDMEFGSVEELRFVCSSDLVPFDDAGGAKGGSGTDMVSTSGTSADVYPMLIFGQHAYGTVPLRGYGSVSPTIIPVGQKTKDDPLAQRGYVGWKTWFTAVILNQVWMARLEVAATDL